MWWWHWRKVVDNLIMMQRRRRPCLLFISPLVKNSCCSGHDCDAGVESQAAIAPKTTRPSTTLKMASRTFSILQFLHPCPHFLVVRVCIWGSCNTPDGVFQTVRFALIESIFLFFSFPGRETDEMKQDPTFLPHSFSLSRCTRSNLYGGVSRDSSLFATMEPMMAWLSCKTTGRLRMD